MTRREAQPKRAMTSASRCIVDEHGMHLGRLLCNDERGSTRGPRLIGVSHARAATRTKTSNDMCMRACGRRRRWHCGLCHNVASKLSQTNMLASSGVSTARASGAGSNRRALDGGKIAISCSNGRRGAPRSNVGARNVGELKQETSTHSEQHAWMHVAWGEEGAHTCHKGTRTAVTLCCRRCRLPATTSIHTRNDEYRSLQVRPRTSRKRRCQARTARSAPGRTSPTRRSRSGNTPAPIAGLHSRPRTALRLSGASGCLVRGQRR